jgi:GalNAc-alpha-(1->4)-GalNAc-alpha-(1->3)-diNAcBac-PP-undecaprenol alpha-1,4-N-acetyl-D-galactosaminyltransferase
MGSDRSVRNVGKHDISIVISDLHGGGTQRVIANLAKAWTDAGYRLCLISHAPAKEDFFALPDDVTRVVMGQSGDSNNIILAIWNNLKRLWALRTALRESDAPVVVSFIAANNILSILACIALGKRLVISERNDPARQSLGRIWDTLRKITYRYADLVTANSHGALDTMRAHVPKSKLRYVPNLLEPALGYENEVIREPEILNVGRLFPHKAQGVLIDAFAELAGKFPEWNLTIAGNGPLADELKEKVASLGLTNRITLPGSVKNVNELYARASVFVLPSNFEGTPNALLEAMQLKAAVIVSDASPGPLEVVEDNRTGLVFPVDNVAVLADKLSALIQDQGLREKLGDAAATKIREFQPAAVLSAWEEVIGIQPSTDTEL